MNLKNIHNFTNIMRDSHGSKGLNVVRSISKCVHNTWFVIASFNVKWKCSAFDSLFRSHFTFACYIVYGLIFFFFSSILHFFIFHFGHSLCYLHMIWSEWHPHICFYSCILNEPRTTKASDWMAVLNEKNVYRPQTDWTGNKTALMRMGRIVYDFDIGTNGLPRHM